MAASSGSGSARRSGRKSGRNTKRSARGKGHDGPIPIDEPNSSFSPSELGRLGDSKRLSDLLDGKIRVIGKTGDDDGDGKSEAAVSGSGGDAVPKLSMQVGVGVDAKDGAGMTALAHSCRSGFNDVAKDLLGAR